MSYLSNWSPILSVALTKSVKRPRREESCSPSGHCCPRAARRHAVCLRCRRCAAPQSFLARAAFVTRTYSAFGKAWQIRRYSHSAVGGERIMTELLFRRGNFFGRVIALTPIHSFIAFSVWNMRVITQTMTVYSYLHWHLFRCPLICVKGDVFANPVVISARKWAFCYPETLTLSLKPSQDRHAVCRQYVRSSCPKEERGPRWKKGIYVSNCLNLWHPGAAWLGGTGWRPGGTNKTQHP